MTFTLTVTSELPLPMDIIWQKVSTMQGVNEELRPLLRMTTPPTAQHLPFTQAPLNRVLFSSWLLLFGWLLFDRHSLQLEDVWDGGFRENSSSWVHRHWRHERILRPYQDGCTLTDTLHFEPYVPVLGHVLLPVIRFVFKHRHRHLQKWSALNRQSAQGEARK